MRKRVLVLGASGKSGNLVVRLLLRQSSVRTTAYVRKSDSIRAAEVDGLEVLEGDVLETDKLADAMRCRDVVIACLSGDLLPQAKSIVEAVKLSGAISRIIWLTGMGIHHEVPGEVGKYLDAFVEKYPDYVRAADVIANSGYSYTLVRAAGLTDEDILEYHITTEGEEIRSQTVSRKAVARFIVDMVVSDSSLSENASLGITN
jgi:uncharacterized protein YbjT (DUF2867 family)